MQMHAAAPALGERRQIASSLGLRQLAKAGCRSFPRQRNVLQFVSRQNEEDAHVRTALLQLARGMQVARPHLQARHAAERFGYPVANLLDGLAPPLSRKRKNAFSAKKSPG